MQINLFIIVSFIFLNIVEKNVQEGNTSNPYNMTNPRVCKFIFVFVLLFFVTLVVSYCYLVVKYQGYGMYSSMMFIP